MGRPAQTRSLACSPTMFIVLLRTGRERESGYGNERTGGREAGLKEKTGRKVTRSAPFGGPRPVYMWDSSRQIHTHLAANSAHTERVLCQSRRRRLQYGHHITSSFHSPIESQLLSPSYLPLSTPPSLGAGHRYIGIVLLPLDRPMCPILYTHVQEALTASILCSICQPASPALPINYSPCPVLSRSGVAYNATGQRRNWRSRSDIVRITNL